MKHQRLDDLLVFMTYLCQIQIQNKINLGDRTVQKSVDHSSFSFFRFYDALDLKSSSAKLHQNLTFHPLLSLMFPISTSCSFFVRMFKLLFVLFEEKLPRFLKCVLCTARNTFGFVQSKIYIVPFFSAQ